MPMFPYHLSTVESVSSNKIYEEIIAAFRGAFDRSSLTQMLHVEMDIHLGDISGHNDTDIDMIRKLVVYMVKQGLIMQLICAAFVFIPTNPGLRKLMEYIIKQPLHFNAKYPAMSHSLNEANVSLAVNAGNLIAGHPLTLDGAQVFVAQELTNIPSSYMCNIDHIGLDLDIARHRLLNMLSTDGMYNKYIYIHILVLSSTMTDYPKYTPSAVLEWAQVSEKNANEFAIKSKKLKKRYASAGGKLKIEIRRYAELPIVHGFSINKSNKSNNAAEGVHSTHLSVCGWSAPKIYDWGQDNYVYIIGNPTGSVEGNLLRIFQGMFARLWAANDVVAKV